MTMQVTLPAEASTSAPAEAPRDRSGRRDPGLWPARLRSTARFVAAVVGAVAIFAVFMVIKGVNPLTAYRDMVTSTFSGTAGFGDILIKACPLILAGLAVAVPARAGLINVGGEGQLIIGGVAAMGVSLALGGRLDGTVSLLLMAVAAAAAGAAWSAVAGGLRLAVGISESVTTLLMNYIALDVMYFLIYDRWKDRAGSGQPTTRALSLAQRLPKLGSGRVHVGILISIGAMLVVWLVLRTTSWGFRLGVVGGNAEAARRAGLRVGGLAVAAMAVGGALAGLGGFSQLAGAEFKLRSGFLAGYGYIGFLASWLARHKPIGVAVAATVLASIVIGGDSLQIDSKLPAASVNVLMALILLIVFGFGRKRVTS
jgi:simple sugar transport system permease protein